MTGTAAYAATHYSYYLQEGMATVIAVVIPNPYNKMKITLHFFT